MSLSGSYIWKPGFVSTVVSGVFQPVLVSTLSS